MIAESGVKLNMVVRVCGKNRIGKITRIFDYGEYYKILYISVENYVYDNPYEVVSRYDIDKVNTLHD
jgi:hypothetical protein